MIIVNTTFVLHTEIADEMLIWIKQKYLASAQRSGAIGTPLLTKVLGDNDPYATTYAIHISFPDLPTAKKWNEGVGASMRRIIKERWGERALSFDTYLEVTE